MDQRLQIKPSKSKTVSDEKSEARELWFKTVVKVLKWKEPGKKSSGIELITDKEWNAYCKETLKINATSKDKAQKKLKDTEELIKKNGGFAKA